MRKITIADFVVEKGQTAAAKLLGVSPPAIHKAIKANRNITLTIRPDGSLESALEKRPFPAAFKSA